jgi:NAD(P)-dependent dehydrogenase (short-subunit alcohol dehydrogenase family)
VVNCAGIAPSMRIVGRKGPHDLDLFAKVLSVNVAGTFNVMTLAARPWCTTEPAEDGQRGVVVNTASIAAFDGQVGQAAYAASKAGSGRADAAGGARPGLARHPGVHDRAGHRGHADAGHRQRRVPCRAGRGVPFPARLARPDEYARLVAMVVEHDYLNGETIRMDGALAWRRAEPLRPKRSAGAAQVQVRVRAERVGVRAADRAGLEVQVAPVGAPRRRCPGDQVAAADPFAGGIRTPGPGGR